MTFGANNKVTTTFTAKDNMSRSMATMRKNVSSLGGPKFGPIGNLVSGFGAMGLSTIAVAAGIGLVAKGLGDAIHGAIEEEKNIAKMTTALEANVKGWDGNTDAIERNIKKGIALAFADDEQREALSSLITRTHDVAEAEKLRGLAMDLARLKGMKLLDASVLIGKVYSGQVSAARRAGIAISANATSTEALAEIQEAAAGQAEAYAKTTGGAIEAVQLGLADLSEDIGTGILNVVGELGTQFDNLNMFMNQNEREARALIPTLELLAQRYGTSAEALLAAADAEARRASGIDKLTGRAYAHALTTLKAGAEAWDEYGAAVVAALAETDREMGISRGHIVEEGKRISEAFNKTPGAWFTIFSRAKDNIVEVAEDLGPSIRDAIRSGRDEAGQGMEDLLWAIEHPKAGIRYEHRLERMIRRAERLRRRAQREGNVIAVAQADKLLTDLTAKYDAIHALSGVITTRIGGIGGGRGSGLGRRASGGPMAAGDSYIVGERGPEVVTPSQNSYVTPNSALGPQPEYAVYLDGRLVGKMLDRREGRNFQLTATSG